MTKSIFIDSTNCMTELCQLGGQFKTDKSPINPGGRGLNDRKGYTAIYSMLFSGMRNKPINFCEVGIADGSSTQMWENYFTEANLFAFEIERGRIRNAQQITKKTKFLETDVVRREILHQSFQATNVLFDVILDDASHWQEHQINVIEVGKQYLKSGGFMIIEDIDRDAAEDYFPEISKDDFIFDVFITAHHVDRSCPNNDKIWFAVKK